jgi:lipoprotein-releasing system ATP-binding protein
MSRPLLETRQLVHEIGAGESRTRVLRGIDLAVDAGELVALTGSSGSGKSSLLYLLGALATPTAGEVLVDGIATAGLDDKARAELRNVKLGFVFQFHFLLPEFSALENVMIPMMRARRGNERAWRDRARALLADLGLSAKTDRRPSQLSGGEQQRVAIARALANEPQLLLADEPTGNLDSHNAEKVFQVFERLNRDGLTVVMVTHDPGLAARCGRRIEVKDGELALDTKRAVRLAEPDAA